MFVGIHSVALEIRESGEQKMQIGKEIGLDTTGQKEKRTSKKQRGWKEHKQT